MRVLLHCFSSGLCGFSLQSPICSNRKGFDWGKTGISSNHKVSIVVMNCLMFLNYTPWLSGCPEKYSWIGGDEPYERQWTDYSEEMEEVSRAERRRAMPYIAAKEDDPTSRENPLLRQMVDMNEDLTERNRNLIERLHEVEKCNRCLTESNRELTKRNRDLTERNRQMGELLLAFVKK